MFWNERSGGEILYAFPAGYSIEKKVLIEIYGQHEHSRQAGFIHFQNNDINIASYYIGIENQFYLILELTDTDNPLHYEKLLGNYALKNQKLFQELKMCNDSMNAWMHKFDFSPRKK
jgi:hypothetical protein